MLELGQHEAAPAGLFVERPAEEQNIDEGGQDADPTAFGKR